MHIYLSLVLFLLLLVITLDIEHLDTYLYNILFGLVNIRVNDYTSQKQNLCNFTVALHVLQQAPVLIHVHLHSWLGLMTSELKGLTKNPPREKTYFYATNSSAPVLMCIDFVAMTCIIMYCRIDMHIRSEKVNLEIQYTS